MSQETFTTDLDNWYTYPIPEDKLKHAYTAKIIPETLNAETQTANFKSSSTGKEYCTTLYKCNCRGFATGKGKPCKHIVRLAIEIGLIKGIDSKVLNTLEQAISTPQNKTYEFEYYKNLFYDFVATAPYKEVKEFFEFYHNHERKKYQSSNYWELKSVQLFSRQRTKGRVFTSDGNRVMDTAFKRFLQRIGKEYYDHDKINDGYTPNYTKLE